MENYFTDISNLNELRQAYKILVKKYHPDLNSIDTTEIMKTINNQYEILFGGLKQPFDKESTNVNYASKNETREDLEKIIIELEKLLKKYPQIIIELVGSWLWLDSKTTGNQDLNSEIKKLGFKWSKNRMMWSRPPMGIRVMTRKNPGNFELLRTKYGSTQILSKNIYIAN